MSDEQEQRHPPAGDQPERNSDTEPEHASEGGPGWSASTPGPLDDRAASLGESSGASDLPGGAAPQPSKSPPPRASEQSGKRPRRRFGPPREPEARLRWLLVVLGSALAVVLPLTVLFAVLWQGADDGGPDIDNVRTTAGLFSERFLTVDSDNIDATRTGVLELSTGAFRRNYEEALETGVFEAILSLGRTRTEATIEEIYVGDVDTRAAHVIVQAEVLSRTVDSEGEAQPPRTLELFLELDLVEQSEGWFVDNVRNLNFGGAAQPTGGGG